MVVREEDAVILFHRTTMENGRRILTDGFRDQTGTYLTDRTWSGVWVSNIPLDANDGVEGDMLLRIRLDPSADMSEFEWVEEGKDYREWLLPARLLNEFGAFAEDSSE